MLLLFLFSFVCLNRTLSMFAKTEINKVKDKLIEEVNLIGADTFFL